MSSNFANAWQKHSPWNLKQTTYSQPTTLSFFMFVLYLVKTSNDFYDIIFIALSAERRIWSLHIEVQLSHVTRMFIWSKQIKCCPGAQPSTPLVNSLVDDMLLKARPCNSQALQRRVCEYRHTPAWSPRLPLDSARDYSMTTGLRQWNAVSGIFNVYCMSMYVIKGTKQTHTRSSATAEKQRVSCAFIPS